MAGFATPQYQAYLNSQGITPPVSTSTPTPAPPTSGGGNSPDNSGDRAIAVDPAKFGGQSSLSPNDQAAYLRNNPTSGTSTSSIVTTNSNTGQPLKPGESFTDKTTGQTYTQGQSFNPTSYVLAVTSAKSGTPTPVVPTKTAYMSIGGNWIDGSTGAVIPAASLGDYKTSSGAALTSASAPSNTNGINSMPNVNGFNSTTPILGDNGIAGMIAYQQNLIASNEQQRKDAEAVAQQGKADATKGILDILGQNTAETARNNAEALTGVNSAQYFAQEKASIAEISTLNEQLNGLIASRDQQIAQITGTPGGTMDFLNNQTAQINRNAAPAINMLQANVNSKAAALQASQGLFAEAQKYIDQAVTAATADAKAKVDNYTTLYTMNKDAIDSMDTKFKDALTLELNIADTYYTQLRSDKTAVGALLMSNPQAGISVSDSLDEAYRKIGVDPKSPDYLLKLAQIASENRSNNGTNGGTGTPSSFSGIMQQAIDADATPEQAAQEAATASEGMGIPVSQAQLAEWVKQAKLLKKTPIPTTSSTTTSSTSPSYGGITQQPIYDAMGTITGYKGVINQTKPSDFTLPTQSAPRIPSAPTASSVLDISNLFKGL